MESYFCQLSVVVVRCYWAQLTGSPKGARAPSKPKGLKLQAPLVMSMPTTALYEPEWPRFLYVMVPTGLQYHWPDCSWHGEASRMLVSSTREKGYIA